MTPLPAAIHLGPHGIAAPTIRIDERWPLLGVIGSVLWRFDGALTLAWIDPAVGVGRRAADLRRRGVYRLAAAGPAERP